MLNQVKELNNCFKLNKTNMKKREKLRFNHLKKRKKLKEKKVRFNILRLNSKMRKYNNTIKFKLEIKNKRNN